MKKTIWPIAALVVVAVLLALWLLPKDMAPARHSPAVTAAPTVLASAAPSAAPTAKIMTPVASDTPAPTSSPTPHPTATPIPDLPPATEPVIDTSELDRAIVSVRYVSDSNKKIKVQIHQGGSTYTYNLPADNMPVRFPLNMGMGEYRVQVLENVGGTRYRPLTAKTFDAYWEDENVPFLQSIQLIRWDESMPPILEAFRLAAEAGDEGKIRAIYRELADTLLYNYELLGVLPSSYLPDIEETYATRLGICYDFASLFAGMLRSVNVPVRMHMGYSTLVTEYHAWNEVLVGNEWIVVDLTVDSNYREAGQETSFEKNPSFYTIQKTY